MLKEILGNGEFSLVKKCLNLVDQKEYAAKIIITKNLSKRNIDKIDKEANICRQLNHPNIIRLHESVQEEGVLYLVFDLALGGELFDDLIAKKVYTEHNSLHLMQQILDAVKYCHDKNIIHRDLKPENILLTSRDKEIILKIADFGLAIQMKDNTPEWFGFSGTAGYLSPEVLHYQKYDTKVDIWACGVIFYILLCGHPPFWNNDQNVLFSQIKNGFFDFPFSEWRDISNQTKQIIKSMLTLNPTKRVNANETLKLIVKLKLEIEINSIKHETPLENEENWNESMLTEYFF